MENISFGATWYDKYISGKAQTNNITKVKKTKYGYLVHMMDNYITLYYIKLIVNDDGSAKAHVRMEKNYCPTQRFTYYFAPDGREIKNVHNSTRKELAVYNALRSEN